MTRRRRFLYFLHVLALPIVASQYFEPEYSRPPPSAPASEPKPPQILYFTAQDAIRTDGDSYLPLVGTEGAQFGGSTLPAYVRNPFTTSPRPVYIAIEANKIDGTLPDYVATTTQKTSTTSTTTTTTSTETTTTATTTTTTQSTTVLVIVTPVTVATTTTTESSTTATEEGEEPLETTSPMPPPTVLTPPTTPQPEPKTTTGVSMTSDDSTPSTITITSPTTTIGTTTTPSKPTELTTTTEITTATTTTTTSTTAPMPTTTTTAATPITTTSTTRSTTTTIRVTAPSTTRSPTLISVTTSPTISSPTVPFLPATTVATQISLITARPSPIPSFPIATTSQPVTSPPPPTFAPPPSSPPSTFGPALPPLITTPAPISIPTDQPMLIQTRRPVLPPGFQFAPVLPDQPVQGPVEATVTSTTASPLTAPPPPVADDEGAPLGFGNFSLRGLRCHIRTCDQTISGRRLTYSRALEIVQEEEYLTAADRDVIRRRSSSHQQQRRRSRQFPSISVNVVENPDAGTTGDLGWTGPVAAAAAVAAASQGVMASGGIGGLGGTSTVSQPSLLTSSALPGQVGGGILPIGNSFVVVQALALVPLGFIALSAFPPYAKPRTYEAVTVIFFEENGQFVQMATSSSSSSRRRPGLVSKIKSFFRGRKSKFRKPSKPSLRKPTKSRLRKPRKPTKSRLRKPSVPVELRRPRRPKGRHRPRREANRYAVSPIRRLVGKAVRPIKWYFGRLQETLRGFKLWCRRIRRKIGSFFGLKDNRDDEGRLLKRRRRRWPRNPVFYIIRNYLRGDFRSKSGVEERSDDVESFNTIDDDYYDDHDPSDEEAEEENEVQVEELEESAERRQSGRPPIRQPLRYAQIPRDQEARIFGFRTRVTLVDREPCALGVTCDIDGNKLVGGRRLSRPVLAEERQTGEDFESEGPPECRTVVNPAGCF